MARLSAQAMSRNGGQSLLKFMYNADGIRTNKIVNGANHVYTLNGTQIVSEAWGNFLLIYLYDESGAPIGLQYRTKSYAANVFDTFYFEKNLQGDIVAVYNAAGNKLGSYTYDAWGNCTISVNSGNTSLQNSIVRTYNPFRYRSYFYDVETNLYYLQSRYYDPTTGRFLNADGYVNANGDLIGFNMYVYCSNNPVMNIDPNGYAWYDWLYDWNNTLVGLFDCVSNAIAVDTLVIAFISGRWEDIKHDWNNGCLNPFNQSEDVALKSRVLSFYKGSKVVKQNIFGSCSLFGTIWLQNNKNSTSLKHEYGHSVQENLLGDAYLLTIFIPSALYYVYDTQTQRGARDYFSMPWERPADLLGGVAASERSNGYKRGSLAWGITENVFGPGIIPFYFMFGY